MDIETNGTAAGTILYHYQPSSGAPLAFIAIFGLGAVFHIGWMIWLRVAYFIPLLIGCIMDAFGYYGRYVNSSRPHDFGFYCLQAFMLILAPIFLSATVYMALKRVILSLDATKQSPVSPRWLSKLFVLGDVTCFLIQLAGLGMQATTDQHIRDTGRVVVVVGLIMQVLLTASFIATAWAFLVRLSNNVGGPTHSWKRFVYTLGGNGVLLLVRNIVRVAEYAPGPRGFVASHEVFIYWFDAVPMAALVIILLIWHPGRLQRIAKRNGKQETSEMKQLVR